MNIVVLFIDRIKEDFLIRGKVKKRLLLLFGKWLSLFVGLRHLS
jgi:hypothetical protein